MDPPGHYNSANNSSSAANNTRHNLFQSSHLPPPSQLHLSPASAFSQSNTLPPIPNIPQNSRFHHQQSSYSQQPVHLPNIQPAPPPVLPPLPSPSGSHHSWPNLHRTSNSRDEIHPSQHSPPSQHNRHEQRIEPAVKRESAQSQHSNSHSLEYPSQSMTSAKDSGPASAGDDALSTTSDFVKKLYKMLEDQAFQHVVCWGPQGDCFVVKDMNEFTKSILPRMFKHSNFASFVRQLNKYDFHKVKNTDDNQFGEHSWTFRHPDFHADRRDALENIKRKVPAQRKATNPSTNRPLSSTSPGPFSGPSSANQQHVESLQNEIERLTQSQDEMSSRIRNLERNYQDVLVEMVTFQRNMAQQDSLMQNLIQYFLQVENGKSKSANRLGGNTDTTGTVSDHNPFLPVQEAQRMMGSYPETDVARASLMQMSQISKRAEVAGLSFGPEGGLMGSSNNNTSASGSSSNNVPARGRGMDRPSSRIWAAAARAGLTQFDGPDERASTSSSTRLGQPMSRQEALAQIEELQRNRPASTSAGFPFGMTPNVFNPPDGSMSDDQGLPRTDGRDDAGPSSTTNAGGPKAAGSWGASSDGNESSPGSHQGLQVFTLGHLMPKSGIDDQNGNWSFDANSLEMLNGFQGISGGPSQVQAQSAGQGQESDRASKSSFGVPEPSDSRSFGESSSAGGSNSSSSGMVQPLSPPRASSSTSQKLTVRRSTFVPGWAVPPRVLLVDDDAVNRKLSSKFLQVFGCAIDVAVDGVGAVNKMNLEKYDLVLMDIVMPKLDGVSATSLIRKFDHMTPIISMTSNSKPNDIMTYYSSGMNDILPKPFTKEGLLDMLEKHLMHLKVIQQMTRVPRGVGIPPLSDAGFEQALTSQASILNGSTNQDNDNNSSLIPMAGPSTSAGFSGLGEDDRRINPLAGMGLTDEQYNMILQNLVNAESFSSVMGMSMGDAGGSSGEKRSLDDSSDGRDGKRSRFEVVE